VTLQRKNKEVYPIVFIFAEQTHGIVEREGAHASLVSYNKDGFDYETWMDNNEFVVLHEVSFVHVESDEDFNKYLEQDME
jgi:hypothetical protein